ncbi:hypothetical protein MAPG_03447 [Magnaporthiopsis poae ATCC 64411]|uniref:Brr2 N-terminal helicase PWI domain-containing protein n=1 Tax=Magnaporthiopsis poae (strain ATCC 64411 / 73-15) TaxID=644358 RepID=A0A0C4DU13_MAGP6|nr:hypothetical protein MAPG_03447 [Magnaporthiopsis poae ATCC 64411]
MQKLIENREKVVWLTRLAKTENNEERISTERKMASEGLRWILDELHGKTGDEQETRARDQDGYRPYQASLDAAKPANAGQHEGGLFLWLQPKKLINLENLVFDQGNYEDPTAPHRLKAKPRL